MKIKAIYVEQYGGWCKLPLAKWEELLKEGIESGGHELRGHMLVSRPPHITRVAYDDSKPSYYTDRKDVLLYHPLDWGVEDYQNALDELKDLSKE